MPGKTEEELTTALEAWRERAALEWFGSEHQDIHGGYAVLPDKSLNIIVDRASKGKITSLETFERESQWRRVNKYGADVLEIIKTYFPEDQSTTTHNIPGHPTPLGDSTGSSVYVGMDSSCSPPAGTQEPLSEVPGDQSAASTTRRYNKRRPYKCSLCGTEGHTGLE